MNASSALATAALLLAPLLPGCGDAGEARTPEGAEVSQGVTAQLLEAQEQLAAPQRERVNVRDMGYDLGDMDTAPIVVIEFSDFGCGYCRKFHAETYPNLLRDYVDAGTVAWKYIPFEIGLFPNGLEAAIAGECAGRQDRFFDMADALFRRQGDWKNTGEPEPVFMSMAGELGLDGDAYARCLSSQEVRGLIEENSRLARQLGVRATPTFAVNGFPLQGALPESVFREVFDGILAEAARLEEEGSGGPG